MLYEIFFRFHTVVITMQDGWQEKRWLLYCGDFQEGYNYLVLCFLHSVLHCKPYLLTFFTLHHSETGIQSLITKTLPFLDSTSSGLPFSITDRPFFIIISSIHTYQFDNFLIDNVHIWLYSICCFSPQSVFLIYQDLFTFCLCLVRY